MKVINFTPLVYHCIASLCFLLFISSATKAQTIKYKYDALGRVTFVEDATNGNRDYDYDAAGNRLNIATNTATDATSEPINGPPTGPAAPTGLFCNQIAAGAWRATWTPVSGATYYIYRTTSSDVSSETNESGPGVVKTYSCKWVRACNSSNVCSAKSYF